MSDLSIQVQHRDGRYASFAAAGRAIPPIGSWVECYSTRYDETGNYNPNPRATPHRLVSGRVYDIHYEHQETGTSSQTNHSAVVVVVFVEDGEEPVIE